jgi:glycosyltransferase involved in cell wall biosynthesis
VTPVVSVVVPTFNRPELLEACLGALTAQTFPSARYGIIVADDAASEQTRQQVAAWRARCEVAGPRIHYLPIGHTRGPAAARNAGWRAAQGTIIAFTDDDCLPHRRWLETGTRAIERGASGVAGRVVMPLPTTPTDYERDAAGLATAEFVTANGFFRRSTLQAIDGFDERFEAAWREDSDLWFTLLERGEPLVSAEDAVVVHPVRSARWGVSLSQQRKSLYNALLFKKHPDLYRQRIQPHPPRAYYAANGAMALFLAGLATRRPRLARVAAASWLLLTTRFCACRLRGTSHRPSHIAEMIVTSVAIPPLAVYWRLRGAIAFRVPFL